MPFFDLARFAQRDIVCSDQEDIDQTFTSALGLGGQQPLPNSRVQLVTQAHPVLNTQAWGLNRSMKCRLLLACCLSRDLWVKRSCTMQKGFFPIMLALSG